jgi:RNA polymerase sigma-70 factor, ECF subfamily
VVDTRDVLHGLHVDAPSYATAPSARPQAAPEGLRLLVAALGARRRRRPGGPGLLQLWRAAPGIKGSVVDDQSPDVEVCRLLAEGHRDQAFECLLARYRTKVYRLAFSFVRSPADAEDLAQEAFVRLWRALPLYDGRASFSTWLYVIARNACLSELRRRGARPTTPLDDVAEPAAPAPAAAGRDLRMDCETLVETLPEPQRQVVRLFYLEDRSYEQVAEMLGMPINTVRSHLHRARRRLAQTMGVPR